MTQHQRRLNPFEFRASFDHRDRGRCCQSQEVLIPLNSGLHLIPKLKLKSLHPLGLNPFEFRASFDPDADVKAKAAPKVLIPLNSGLHLILHSENAVLRGNVGLNPFEFRASFDPPRHVAEAVTKAS